MYFLETAVVKDDVPLLLPVLVLDRLQADVLLKSEKLKCIGGEQDMKRLPSGHRVVQVVPARWVEQAPEVPAETASRFELACTDFRRKEKKGNRIDVLRTAFLGRKRGNRIDHMREAIGRTVTWTPL